MENKFVIIPLAQYDCSNSPPLPLHEDRITNGPGSAEIGSKKIDSNPKKYREK